MTSSPRIVEGTIFRLRCDACESIFPHFIFSGEKDSDTVGLCSASACGKDEVAIVEADPPEWNDFDRMGIASVEKKLAALLARSDLKVVRLLRIERAANAAAGSSFSDFKKTYKPPILIYSCVCCANGESRTVEEVTVGDFQRAGGRIFLTGRLIL